MKTEETPARAVYRFGTVASASSPPPKEKVQLCTWFDTQAAFRFQWIKEDDALFKRFLFTICHRLLLVVWEQLKAVFSVSCLTVSVSVSVSARFYCTVHVSSRRCFVACLIHQYIAVKGRCRCRYGSQSAVLAPILPLIWHRSLAYCCDREELARWEWRWPMDVGTLA
jgi:hypothetical protein